MEVVGYTVLLASVMKKIIYRIKHSDRDNLKLPHINISKASYEYIKVHIFELRRMI